MCCSPMMVRTAVCQVQHHRWDICLGGGWYGWRSCNSTAMRRISPQKHVTNNRVTAHLAYGILFYNVTTAADNYNQAIGNYIENIDGSVLSGNSGAGIYVANQGGAVVNGNTIRNCCINTSSSSLAPAGIGINGTGVYAPFTITGNVISNIQNYYGIYAVVCPFGG